MLCMLFLGFTALIVETVCTLKSVSFQFHLLSVTMTHLDGWAHYYCMLLCLGLVFNMLLASYSYLIFLFLSCIC